MGLFSLFKKKQQSIEEDKLQEDFHSIQETFFTNDDKDEVTDSLEVVTEQIEIDINAENLYEELGEYDPTMELATYKIPSFDILNISEPLNIYIEDIEEVKNKIINIFEVNGINIDTIKAITGYLNTLYEVRVGIGFRISKIKQLKSDLIFALQTSNLSIEPIVEKGIIGIIIPNKNPQILPIASILTSADFVKSDLDLPLIVGKSLTNGNFIIDLTKKPHILIAGATGQGKSVLLNVMLTSLLYKKHPAELKFVLIDPNILEFNSYSAIESHFLAKLPDIKNAIITDTSEAIKTLNSLCVEMNIRYKLLEKAKARNIKEYNTKFKSRQLNPHLRHRFLPYIVLMIDEYANLLTTGGKAIETLIEYLARKAHVVGIHIILATQRPTKNIITGNIKSNFLVQIAFKVASSLESRIIIDNNRAEELSGSGDILYREGMNITRLQVPYISTEEIDRILTFIGEQRGYPTASLLPDYPINDCNLGIVDLNKRDELFEDAARLIVIHQQASTSLIQRKFSIGYSRAGQIMEQLEVAGIIGPYLSSEARQIFVFDENMLERILNELNK